MKRLAASVVASVLAIVFIAACGSNDTGGVQKVTPSDRVFAIDDFLSLGFKEDKQYDVAELPAGVDAWQGCRGPDPYSRKQYELRFYTSHEDAVEYGPALAEEVTGEDAAAYRKNPTWKEGAKDRWQSAVGSSGAVSSLMPSGPSPKYGDYLIFGNVLMLCEGADSRQGLERCEALVDALTSGEAE